MDYPKAMNSKDDSSPPPRRVTFGDQNGELIRELHEQRERHRNETITQFIQTVCTKDDNFSLLAEENVTPPLATLGLPPIRLPSPKKPFKAERIRNFRNSREFRNSKFKDSQLNSSTVSMDRSTLCPEWLKAGECPNRRKCLYAHGTDNLVHFGQSNRTNYEPPTSFKTSIVERVQKVSSNIKNMFKSSKSAGQYDLQKSK